QVLPMVVEINNPPSQPGTVTASGTFETGKSVNVSWYQSTDVDGDPISYDLEVSINGGTYSKIQNRVTGRSYDYTIPAGTTSIAFRVIAYANGMYGIYRTSTTYTVTSNAAPSLTVATTDNRTLYENDQFNVTGQVIDTDVGNVVTTKYSINGGTERAITATISQGAAVTYNKVLTFKQGKLFDGANAITDTLADGSQ